MEGPCFEWDPAKSRANAAKHGVSFEEAASVFEDEHALLIPDPAHSTTEDRFILLGLSVRLRILVVVHCERENGAILRIISARPATRHERSQYRERRR